MVKKNPQRNPRGFADNVRALLVAGTVVTRTHAPLARHIYYVFSHIEIVDVLAHYGGDVKIHDRSRADLVENVKPRGISHPRPEGWLPRPPKLTTLRCDIWPVLRA